MSALARRRRIPLSFALSSMVAAAGCDGGDPDAIRVSMDQLVTGVELAAIDDPDAVVQRAVALVGDGDALPGTIGIENDPVDERFDVVLSYRTGGCPALPELAVDLDDGTLRFEVEIVDTGGDCPLAEYIEAIGIDLVPDADGLPVDATFG